MQILGVEPPPVPIFFQFCKVKWSFCGFVELREYAQIEQQVFDFEVALMFIHFNI